MGVSGHFPDEFRRRLAAYVFRSFWREQRPVGLRASAAVAANRNGRLAICSAPKTLGSRGASGRSSPVTDTLLAQERPVRCRTRGRQAFGGDVHAAEQNLQIPLDGQGVGKLTGRGNGLPDR